MKIGYIRVSTQEQNTMRQEVLVESISRFARNTKDLLELVEQLTAKGVEFISQKESIDTSTPTGKFMLTIFGAVAELEREYILQRQRDRSFFTKPTDPCLHGSGKWNKHHQDTKNRCGNPGYSDEKRIAASIVERTWRTIFVALSYAKRHHPRAERYLEIMELFRQRIRPTHGGARRRGTNLTTRHCTRSNDLLSPAYLLHRFATSGSSY